MSPKFTNPLPCLNQSSPGLSYVSFAFLSHPKDALPGEIEGGHRLKVEATGGELLVHTELILI